jgi:hypothetical protein
MAPPDPPIAEAHVAIGIMPAFFAENPRQWFQTAEAQFATARPTPNNGQKYFHLLQKLPAEIMNNCSDIITTCTLAAASNSGDPYTAMKSAILDYTQKPKWSCYMDLHSLPPQGDIRPSLLMAKLINTLPHGTDTKSDLFYSFFMFRMPQYLREVLAANEYTTAREMAVAADRVWDLRQSAPAAAAAAAYRPRERSASPHQHRRNADRGRDSGRAADRGRSQSRRRGRAQTPHDQEFPDNGTCWYHWKYQNRSSRCRTPCNWNGPDARPGNGESSR